MNDRKTPLAIYFVYVILQMGFGGVSHMGPFHVCTLKGREIPERRLKPTVLDDKMALQSL